MLVSMSGVETDQQWTARRKKAKWDRIIALIWKNTGSWMNHSGKRITTGNAEGKVVLFFPSECFVTYVKTIILNLINISVCLC